MSEKPPLRLSTRAASAHKGAFGRALLIGGSRGMSGSIALSAIAALHTGSGLVTAAVPDRCLETVASFHPAVMTIPLEDDDLGRFSLDAAEQIAELLDVPDAVGCGPGMTPQPGSIRLVERILQACSLPRVLDADAINALAIMDWATSAEDVGPMVLTPHPGEFARLTGVKASDRDAQVAAATKLAEKTKAVIVLKGAPTIVISAGHQWINDTGNPGMATAGSGDVLTGMITSLLGQGLTAWDSARLGVWIHGRAGDLAAERTGQAGMTAVTLSSCVPEVVASVS